MPDIGLTLTQQPPLSPTATVALDAPLGDIWQRLAVTDRIKNALETGVDELVGHLRPGQRGYALEQHGVTALNGLFASAIAALVENDPICEQRRKQAYRLVKEFGVAEWSVMGIDAPIDQIYEGPIAVLRAANTTPTIAVILDDRFGALRADQRTEIIGFLAELATAVDLRIVATGRWQRKLACEYREQLPVVSEQCSSRTPRGHPGKRAEAARDVLDPDGRKIHILRQLANEPSETLSYNELYTLHQTTKGAIRQCLTTGESSLAELGLVETFSRTTGSGNAAELLAAGRELLDRLDAEIGRQQRLEAVVSDTGNPSDNSRVTPPARESRHHPAPQSSDDRDADRSRLSQYHQVQTAARHRYAAATGSTTENSITLVDHPIGTKDDRGESHWYYDREANRLLVGAEYDNPMQWWVCIALALANARTFRHVLTPERFATGKLGDLLTNHTNLLRNSRCLGYLKDADATAESYTDALLKAADDLRELTRDLHHENYENRNRLRADILREAHGLAGTIVHLIDLADVDVIREARIPRFSQDFAESQQSDLAETLTIGATIQSRYGESTAYRQLLEFREDKRESAIPTTVDADDPFGELIGSFVIVGKSVDELADPLRRRLSNKEMHEDAPEFAVPIPIRKATDRSRTAQAIQVVCRQKSIRPTRAAISMITALTGTPYDAARALHNLESETKAPNRKLRLNEVRYSLSALEPTRMLPELSKPALSKIVHALLVAETPLVQSELAARADVSSRSVRTYVERLAAFDFIHETGAGWRFMLPFHTHEERGQAILPWYVTTGDETADQTFARDVFGEAIYDLLDPERYADPADPVAGALFGDPAEVLPALREGCSWLRGWIPIIRKSINSTTQNDGLSEKAVIGTRPDQVSLSEAVTS